MAEFSVGPTACKVSRVEVFDLNICIFCKSPFTKKKPAIELDVQKCDSFFDACNERQNFDNNAKQLLINQEHIYNGTITIRYHRNCRSTFASPEHIKRDRDKYFKYALNASNNSRSNFGDGSFGGDGGGEDGGGGDNGCFTRSKVLSRSFDWKNCCFICSGICSTKHRSSWSMVESCVNDQHETNKYSKVLRAAQQMNDTEMVTRLAGVPNGDLVALEARYHRTKNCYVHYVDVQNIASKISQQTNMNIHGQAVHMLIEEFRSPIIEERNVFLLTTLRDRFRELLQKLGHDNPEAYSSQKLKLKLVKEWPEISFVSQSGSSDFICPSNITVSDALRKAGELTKYMKDHADFQDIVATDGNVISEESIVHQAVGIIRRRVLQTKALDGEYHSSAEMSLEALKSFVDPLLYKVVGWISKKSLFDAAADISDMDLDLRCLTIACDITTLATSVMSPKHLGLAVNLHHVYGSRKLIEDMYSHGYSISYTELRHFLTSAAVHVASLQEPSLVGSYRPPEITSNMTGEHFIVLAADNWDHNERTVDGKNTTHAMTSICVQQKSDAHEKFPRIIRIGQRTIDSLSTQGGDLHRVLHYEKPRVRPEPVFDPPATLDDMQPRTEVERVHASDTLELLYNVSRSRKLHHGVGSPVPPWSAFHSSLIINNPMTVSIVSFNPIIMANPTDLSTVYTTLKRAKESMKLLGQNYAPVFFDMGLLTKALEVTWARPEELAGVIPCEGGMHLLMSVFSAIGHLYGDAGLRQLLHESGVFAAGSVQQILSGRDFDRALYAMKLVDEALNARLLLRFSEWCDNTGKQIPQLLTTFLDELDTAFATQDAQVIAETIGKLSDAIDECLLPILTEFRVEGREASPTFKFWDDFLCRVLRPFKVLVSSARHGFWEEQQSAKAELIPLLFAANRTNYARYMPVMLLLMKRIPPEVLMKFRDGNFVAKLTEGNFNGVWLDYTLETTANKALKGTGGIIGLTLRQNALVRWFLSRPVTAQYSMQYKKNVVSPPGHHGIGKASQKRWNNDVKKMYDIFDDSYIDPFDLSDPPSQLLNISSGAVASSVIEKSLVNAMEKGAKMADQFVNDRLIGDEECGRKSIYDTLSRSNIKTMTDMKKKVKISNKDVSFDGEMMYLRLLAVNAQKRVPLLRVMSFENSPVPLSMFTEEGLIASCNKSDYMHKLEELVPGDRIATVDLCDAIIFDGHAIIQTLPTPHDRVKATFKDMADAFMSHIMSHSKNTASLHVVFDRYLECSIKCQTREKRGTSHGTQVYHIQLDIAIPANWMLFLTSSQNKANLAKFYTKYLADNAPDVLGDTEMYVSGGYENTVIRIAAGDVSEVPLLASNQEEADTRLILHAVYAANNGADNLVICSPDTDVLVLLTHHRSIINAAKIYMLTGRSGKHARLTRYIPVHDIHDALNQAQRDLLLPVYCLTGCDTVSSFHGRGKKTAYRILKQHAEKYCGLITLGTHPTISKDEKQSAVAFVGALYGKPDCLSLNVLRCERANNKKLPAKKLPPTEDSFYLHLQRCAYQLMIWRQAGVPMQELMDPTNFGYEKITDGRLYPKMMNQSPAAPELLNELLCDCVANSCDENCSCLDQEQPCTAACSCKAILFDESSEDMPPCSNPLTKNSYNIDSDSDSEHGD